MTEGVYECPKCFEMNMLPKDIEEVFNDMDRPTYFNISDFCSHCGVELVIPIRVRFCFEVNEDYDIEVQEEE